MNADPRRAEKIQRYVPKNTANGEDLTPDYMNIMGHHPTTANAAEAADKHAESSGVCEHIPQQPPPDEAAHLAADELAVTSNAANVIPTSPQYGVAIIPNASAGDLPTESVTHPTETVTDTIAKAPDENKDIHSTPSRNERFKVVKIASLEPFKRGRWKCMDYVDEAPPPNIQTKATQSASNIQVAGGVYLQTQSLPQQQIQQMLLQSGFANGGQFFSNVPTQIMPQTQYFYPQVTNIQNQNVPQQVPSSMPAQFINNQAYFPTGVVPNAAGFTMPQSYPNVQYLPANLIQNQNSAFVPTSQTVQIPANFQQSQTYAGQANVSQSNITQPLVNGHSSYTQPTNEQASIPTQTVKNVIINSQPTPNQPVVVQQYQQPNATFTQQNSTVPQVVPPANTTTSNFVEQNTYQNHQFNELETNEAPTETNAAEAVSVEATGENVDDPSKTNPVVNAIDNKIEQAMDLVKSHLMYTVREEVEVLKEKIAELMERIQQLETENNFLRSLVPKTQNVLPPPVTTTTPVTTSNVSSTSTVAAAAAAALVGATASVASVSNASQNVVAQTNQSGGIVNAPSTDAQ